MSFSRSTRTQWHSLRTRVRCSDFRARARARCFGFLSADARVLPTQELKAEHEALKAQHEQLTQEHKAFKHAVEDLRVARATSFLIGPVRPEYPFAFPRVHVACWPPLPVPLTCLPVLRCRRSWGRPGTSWIRRPRQRSLHVRAKTLPARGGAPWLASAGASLATRAGLACRSSSALWQVSGLCATQLRLKRRG